MDMSSMPAAPLLAFTCCHASRTFSRARVRSSRLACVAPYFPAEASGPLARRYGVCVADRGSRVDPHPTGLGLPALASAVLCPRLTPPSSTHRLPVMPLPVPGAHGMEFSPDKNANSGCTTSAFTTEPEPGASVWGATSSGPLALYAVSVHRFSALHSGFLSRLVTLPQLPSASTSRILSWKTWRFTYRRLQPH
jgi:hypothetical protein